MAGTENAGWALRSTAVKRPRWFRARRSATPMLLATLVLVAYGNTASAASSPAPLSLSGCVKAWNTAVLGNGRKTIRKVARNSHKALIAVSSDGVCVLAFSPDAGYTQGQGVYFSALRGDYDMRSAPFDGQGSPHPPLGGEAKIREPAATEANVEVQAQAGMIKAIAAGTTQTRPYTLLNRGPSCKTVVPSPSGRPNVPDGYQVTKSTVSCGWVRSLIFAYEAGQGSLLGQGSSGAPIRRLAGWRCSGAGPFPARSMGEAAHFRLKCVRGKQIIEARGAGGHVVGAAEKGGHILGS